MTMSPVDALIASLGARALAVDSDLIWLFELLRAIDLACDRMRAVRAEEPIVQATLLVEEFAKIVEAKRLYDAAIEARL